MKKVSLSILPGLLSVIMLASVSSAPPNFDDIDGSMGTEWKDFQTLDDSVGYQGYVGPGWGGQDFDIEEIGVYVDETYLYIGLQTGFELNHKETGEEYPGNIALGFGTMTGQNSYQIENPNNYQFTLEFDFGSFQGEDKFHKGYDFLSHANLKLYEATSWNEVDFKGDRIGPFPFTKSNGTELGYLQTRDAFTRNNSTNQTGAAITKSLGGKVAYNHYKKSGTAYGDGETNDDPYYNTIEAAIRLDSLTDTLKNLDIDLNNGFTANVFWIMSCNNDMLGASYTQSPSKTLILSQTPEPATLVLFGLGLLGIGSWGRRQKA
jgi:hypothetical protein